MRELDSWIEAGAIVRPHGLRGEVIVDMKRDLLELVIEDTEIRTTQPAGGESYLLVERAREHQGRLIVKFRGVESVEAAEGLRGATLWMTRDEIGALGEGRWFVQDILGIEVVTDDGERLGTLAEVMHMPANDVYVVKGGGGEVLLPATEEVVREVDVEAGRMVVHLIEGLRRGAG